MSTKLAPLMSSAKQDWQTPENVLDLVRQLGPIALDPASCDANPTKAARFFTPDTDGLHGKTWWFVDEGSVCYLNPCFDNIDAWASKWLQEARQNQAGHYVLLVPVRTDTKWWRIITRASRVCFLRGRLKFKGATSTAPFPTAIAYEGPRPGLFEDVFREHGWTVRP